MPLLPTFGPLMVSHMNKLTLYERYAYMRILGNV